MNGQATPIDVDLGGPIFADGAGAFDIIGNVALAEGYSTSFINFDHAEVEAQIKQAKSLGIEKFRWRVESLTLTRSRLFR